MKDSEVGGVSVVSRARPKVIVGQVSGEYGGEGVDYLVGRWHHISSHHIILVRSLPRVAVRVLWRNTRVASS